MVTANVNQHTEHGLLTFPLAADITLALRTVGFVLVNELVWSKDRTGGKLGVMGFTTSNFRELPVPAKPALQERARVHHRCRQAPGRAEAWQDCRCLRKPHGSLT